MHKDMTVSDIVEVSKVRNTLEDLCARNLSAEIHYGGASGEENSARVRFLALDSDSISVDKPQRIGGNVELRAGQPITVYFQQDDSHWAFESKVIKTTKLVRLNDRQRVVGMSLTIPREIVNRQRRSDYRVPAVSRGISCVVSLESEDVEYSSPVETGHGIGIVHNLSKRGVGVLLDGKWQRLLKLGRVLYVSFRLPDLPRQFVMRTEIRHAREIISRDNTLVGLRFLEMPFTDNQSALEEIALFVVAEQRRKLRRKR